MIALQVLSKVINTGSTTILDDNLLDESYFVGYEAEFQFIQDHVKEYGNVPDRATFLGKFPDLELVEVTESDRYLVDTIREENLYYRAVPIMQKVAELLQGDANAAAEYMMNAVKELQPNYGLNGVDIVHNGQDRYDKFVERKEHQEKWFFTSGFPELDDQIHGIQRGEEFFVIVARTNQGKSWVLEKMCTHVWQTGFNVGYISPEIGADSIGYRFDTLFNHFSNKDLVWGKDGIDEDMYSGYIDQLATNEAKFIVSTPEDFDKRITVSKLRNWIKQYKLDLVAIDGITYMSDERYKRGDNKTTTLTNISEDLMSLSMEMGVPILAVVQANRTGVVEKGSDDTPELESIRDSDGISHNASKVLSINQKEFGILTMTVKKQRNGIVGQKLTYNWDINIGEFQYVPPLDDDDTPPFDPAPSTSKPTKKTDVF